MTSALQYMALSGSHGCVELWNQARLAAYLQVGIRPSGFTVTSSACLGLTDLLADPTPPVYYDPEVDDAPWWDPHAATAGRAARFAGLLPLDVTGLDDESTAVDMVTLVDGSSMLANRRDIPRQLAVRALLIGQDCCAVRYGLQWLKETLTDAADVPGGVELQWLTCCPTAAGEEEACADSTGDCDPAVDPDCVEVADCVDPYAALPLDEWWAVLAGVSPSEPVKVVESYGVGCGCGGAPIIEVQFGLTATIQQAWRPLRLAGAPQKFTTATTRPTFRFRKRPKTVQATTRTRARLEHKAVLRGNRWCPVGGWGWADVQQGGGEGFVTVQEAVESVGRTWERTPCDGSTGCRPRQIRLILDEVNSVSYFETVRWVNNEWAAGDPLGSVPCNCPITIVELERVTMQGSPPVATKDKSVPGTGDDCCFVGLSWTGTTTGDWAAVPNPDVVTGLPFTEWGAAGTRPQKSGWPPVGCTMVVARNCPPGAPPADVCPESVDCQITIAADGTWLSPVGYDPKTFPPPQCRFTVAAQVLTPITETVDETVYGRCPGGCADDIDPLADPTVVRQLPPGLPHGGGARICLPATTSELRLGWSDHRQWDVAAPVIEVFAGLKDAYGLEVLIWRNPASLDWADPANWAAFADCNAIGAWSLSRVPAGVTIRIDTRTRRVTALLPGGRRVLASQLLESPAGQPVLWPLVVSCGLVASVRAGRNQVDTANATASMWVAGAGF